MCIRLGFMNGRVEHESILVIMIKIGVSYCITRAFPWCNLDSFITVLSTFWFEFDALLLKISNVSGVLASAGNI